MHTSRNVSTESQHSAVVPREAQISKNIETYLLGAEPESSAGTLGLYRCSKKATSSKTLQSRTLGQDVEVSEMVVGSAMVSDGHSIRGYNVKMGMWITMMTKTPEKVKVHMLKVGALTEEQEATASDRNKES